MNQFELEATRKQLSARPLRASNPKVSGKMERSVDTCMVKVATAHMRFMESVFDAMGVKISKVRDSSKAVFVPISRERCCEHEPDGLKEAIKAAELTTSLDLAINAAGNQLFSEIWGVTNIHAQTPIQKSLWEIVNLALKDGFAQAASAWEKRAAKDQAWADSNPLPNAPIKPTPEMAWMQEIWNGGFTRVRDKVFNQLIPSLKQSIAEGIASGLSMEQIALNLYGSFGPGSSAGSGYLWQWQRLVRTEMHNAMFRSNLEEFKDCGAKWIRWSSAVNNCKICAGIQATNSGYYPLEKCPVPPHPNCRCSTTPVFNLPRGVVA